MNYFLQKLIPEEREAMIYQPTTVDFLEFIASRYPTRIALSDPDKSVRFEELPEIVGRKRALLAQHGVQQGANVGLMGKNSVDLVEWFLAVTSYGCTAVMLPPSLQLAALPGILAYFETALLVRDGGEAVGNVPVVDMTSIGDKAVPAAKVAKKDRAAIFFTGGTTGKPKGVMLSHGAIMRGSLNGTYRDGTMDGQVLVAALPFTHVFGLIFSLLSGLYSGAHVGVCGDMKNVFREMQRVHPTTMVAVPGMAEMMLMIGKTRGMEALGGKLKTIICGAAPVPERLHAGFLPYGVEVLAGYGMTETANLVTGNLDMDLHPTSVGRQYPEQESRIVDGELQVRGDMLCDGYWKDPAATAAAFTEDGWLRTGDLARFDEDGFMYIVGRIKNLIILDNGENVSPEEVEAFYYRCPLVKDCLVSETEINGKGAILMEVQPMPGVEDQALLDELKKLTKELPTTMQPARFDIRHEDFEKSPSMKIIRK